MSGIVGSKLNIKGSGLVGSLGTDGQHLLSSGAGKTNVFETVGGGAVLQVKAIEVTESISNDSALPAAVTEFNIAFTPTASTSKLWLQLHMSCSTSNNEIGGYFYDSTGSAVIGAIGDAASARSRVNWRLRNARTAESAAMLSAGAWFTPGDTTARTIQVYACGDDTVMYINQAFTEYDNNTMKYSRSASTFTITEYDGSIVTIA